MIGDQRQLKKAIWLFIMVTLTIVRPIEVKSQSHALFTALLRQYVHEGGVNYKELRNDARLERYIQQLVATNPDSLHAEDAKLAFWINAYNAYTLKAICDHYPVESINDLHTGGLILGSILKTTVWDEDFVVIGGKQMTLNQIEHSIVRPVFRDARAHFALVCASKSCPPLRSEAFEGQTLQAQLDDQGRAFLSSDFRNRLDSAKRVAYLSKIFSWYSSDFGKSDSELLLFIAKFLPSSIARDIRKNLAEWTIENLDFDWTLNE
jgi:hypothetical protein